ncbi:MAG TPA: ferrochelatase [Candidatus Limnocylindria bacterium]|jgi:ferrochelatase
MKAQSRLGVLLMTYGSPDDLDDMPRYLTAVRGGRAPSPEVISEFRRRYDVIGGSPLIPITQAQAAAVETKLRADGLDAYAVAGMRFSEPSIAAGLAALAGKGCTEVVGIIMSPQFSGLLMSGYERALSDAASALGSDAPDVRLAPAWYRQESFLQAVTIRIREGLERLPAVERDRAPVLLTAHSLPRRVAEAEPGYLDQLRETAEMVAARAELPSDRWHFCWQSAGHEPGEWMKPDFADLLPELRDGGHRSVLVAPVQFLADHLEVLYDIDIGAQAQAQEAGMAFARIDSLNVMPEFVAALCAVASSPSSPSAD